MSKSLQFAFEDFVESRVVSLSVGLEGTMLVPLTIKHQRYAHAKQFKRANRALRTLRTYLGRVIRDVARKLFDNIGLLDGVALDRMLALVRCVLGQKQRQRGQKLYSLHAPEVECIGKGKAPALRVRRQGAGRHDAIARLVSSSPM